MTQLTFHYAAMNAGKSTHLLQANHNYIRLGMKTLLLTSALDGRFGSNKITSRLGVSAEALGLSTEDDVFALVQHHHTEKTDGKGLSCILIDEAQFLTPQQVWQLSDVVDTLKIPVKAYGLRTDFMGDAFEGSKTLMSIADEIDCIENVCFCGSRANMVVRTDGHDRILTSGNQVEIEEVGEGAEVKYHSVCRRHYKEVIKCTFWNFCPSTME